MNRLKIVTTSWDDGDPTDLRVADLLSSRGLCGTFYVPINGYLGKQRVSDSGLRDLHSQGFEIGAHSMSHKILPQLTSRELDYEVRSCKTILEQCIGHEVTMFCYPNGRHDAEVIRCVRAAGYLGARTTRMLNVNGRFRPFQMPTSLQAYPHPRLAYMRNFVRARNPRIGFRYITRLSRFDNWLDLGKHLFDEVLEHGGIWHLYGHSWEVAKLGIWDELNDLLAYVSNRDEVLYASNGKAMAAVNHQNGSARAQRVQTS